MRDDFNSDTKETLAKRVGLRCSNPNCRQLTSAPSIDPEKAINIGVAAHITAASAGGKRYDSTLTTDQRKYISNGIWLCQNCAKLIDNDEARYPTPLLQKWKSISEEAALYEVENKTINEIKELIKNINVISINQTGGQTAHTIVNQRPLRRDISSSDQLIIIQELKKHTPEKFNIWLSNGDPEAQHIATQIKDILKQVGWIENGFVYNLAGSYPEGIEIAVGKQETKAQDVLYRLLFNVSKLNITGKKYEDVNETTIIVGPNPMNYL